MSLEPPRAGRSHHSAPTSNPRCQICDLVLVAHECPHKHRNEVCRYCGLDLLFGGCSKCGEVDYDEEGHVVICKTCGRNDCDRWCEQILLAEEKEEARSRKNGGIASSSTTASTVGSSVSTPPPPIAKASDELMMVSPEARFDTNEDLWRCGICEWEIETDDGVQGRCNSGHTFDLTIIEGWFAADVQSEYEDDEGSDEDADSEDGFIDDEGDDFSANGLLTDSIIESGDGDFKMVQGRGESMDFSTRDFDKICDPET